MKIQLACAVMAGVMMGGSGKASADVERNNVETGRIRIEGVIHPGACEIKKLEPYNLDFGEINARDLKWDGLTIWPHTRKAELEIHCTGRTAVAISASDDLRGGLIHPFLQWTEDVESDGLTFGGVNLQDINGVLIETDTEKPVGIYALVIQGMSVQIQPGAQFVPAHPIRRHASTGTGSWGRPGEANVGVLNHRDDQYSWSVKDAIPVQAYRFHAAIEVYPVFMPAEKLNITKAVNFHGLTTITLTY